MTAGDDRMTPAQAERLTMLAEECAEVIHAVTKILRHGYDSHHPARPGWDNRQQLEAEVGDLAAVLAGMRAAGDIEIDVSAADWTGKLTFTHHQHDSGGAHADPLPAPVLADGAWARPLLPGSAGAALAAILKALAAPRPSRDVRLMAAFVLEPRLLVPLLPPDQASEWLRLVGSEAQALAGNAAAFSMSIDAEWGSAVLNHRGNNRLIENLQSGTWAPGAGLEKIETGGWPDGRAGFVLEALRGIDLGAAANSLPDDIQRWTAA